MTRPFRAAAAILAATGALVACGSPDRPTIRQSGPTAETELGIARPYGADAGEWNVPRPRAVYSIFPSDPVLIDPGLVHLSDPPAVPTLVLVGDKDTTVGRIGADTFWKWLAPVARKLKTFRLLHSDPDGLWFDHESLPTTEFNVAMRRVFWDPLDELAAEVR